MRQLGEHWKKILLVGGYIGSAILLDLASGAFVLQTGLAICYPPAGLYLAAILLLGWWALPLAFFNPVFSVLVTLHSPDIPFEAVLGIGVASMVSPAIILAFLRRTTSQNLRLHTLRGVTTFVSVALLAVTVESLTSASVYTLTGLSSSDAFGAVATGWWISNIIPYLTLTPVILLWFNRPPSHPQLSSGRLVLQSALIAVAIPLSAWIALTGNDGTHVSRLYVALLPILWAALVGGIIGATWASLFVTVSVLILAPSLLSGSGIVVEAQFFLLVATLTGLVAGVSVTELRFSEERYRTLFDGILDGVSRSTHEEKFVDVNPAMVKMFGFADKEEMLAVDIKKDLYFDPKDRRSLFLDTGQERVEYFRMRCKDGSEIWVEDHGHYVHDKNGNVIFHEGILRDITSRRMIEAERERLISELEAKNAELERFTYTVSHDLKSPLITINGFLGQLQDDIASGNVDRVEHDSQRIQDAVGKMHQLLKELLELSRIGRLMNPPELVPFEGLAREALVLVHGQLETRGVTFTLGPDLPVVYGDRLRLIEVLQNLIDNAVKFMGEQPNPHIEIGQQGEEGGMPVFYVKDNGIGIAPEYHKRIFGLFNKLDTKTDGTGIGLALVKRIIEFHGGRIWVESAAGKGSTFYFTLPVSQTKEADD